MKNTRNLALECQCRNNKNPKHKIPMIRKSILIIAITMASILPSHAAVIIDSGLNGITASTFGVLDGNNTGKAVGFSLGTPTALGVSAAGGYSLDSITVQLRNPRATVISASDYTFSLWSSDSDPSPLIQLTTFTSINLTATTTANYTLAVSAPFILQPSTTYWIVAQSTLTDTGSGTNLPIWFGTGGTATTASGISLTSPVGRFGTSGAPSAWTSSSGLFNDIQINAIAVPEPSSALLLLVGAGMLMKFRLRSRL